MIEINLENIWSTVTYDRNSASPLKNILNLNLKVDVPSAEYTYLYKTGQWDGKTNLWQDLVGNYGHYGVMIMTGLIPKLVTELNKVKIPWKIKQDNRNLPTGHKFNQTKIELRNYQFDAIKAALSNSYPKFGWWPRGVFEMATGSGKTEVAVAMYEMNPVPTFFLVHRKDLLLQTKERFEKYGHKAGVIGDNKFNPENNLNIATMQTLYKIFEEQLSQRSNITFVLLNSCEQIFIDECHIMASNLDKGNEFVNVISRFEAPFRWGLTATPFMRRQYDNLLLEGVAGQAIYSISTDELVKLGYLTKPKVIMKYIPGKLPASMSWRKIQRSNKAKGEYWREVEMKGIKFNELRTDLIIDEILSGPFPVLVLVKTIDQAEFIRKLFSLRTGKTLTFLSGKDPTKLRKQTVQQLRNGEIKALIVTTIFDEGIDVPELRKLILASGGQSQVKAIQRAGRILRLASGKSEAIVVDFQDGHHPMLERHANSRKQTWKEQQFEIICEKEK